ncbi:hypothetical protein Dole_2388 [Desulfosudis oleivorans Hxd3]|uniref:DUF2029 domain-containing protein n=1 Tax=Desulfosudis oleivorans (strain DSM 6200 / JCM 39069 / Hxd3) TaxID=96561 RepID=A8ZVK5_DESOH|nr:hypothetical protein Dole_2388 [Desulfosudis oleivorans Hxd3]
MLSLRLFAQFETCGDQLPVTGDFPNRRLNSRFFRVLCLLSGPAVLFFFINGVKALWLSFLPPYIFMKDMVQDWLLAKALLAGISPYDPLPVLAARFLGPWSEFVILRHPSPHPPIAAIAALPLGLLSCREAAFVWLGFELMCIGVSVYLVLKWWGGASLGWATGLTILLIAWAPFGEGLLFGQSNTLVLLLLICAWQTERQWLCGVFIGCSLAIKFMGWPILLFCLLRKKWRVVGTAFAVLIAGHMAAVLVMEADSVRLYYSKVIGSVDAIYRFADGNFSVWSLGWRMFVGISGPFKQSINILPLFANAPMAMPVSFFLTVVFVAGGMLLALKRRDSDVAWALLFCLSAVTGPISWIHYLVLLLPPAAVILKRIMRLGFPLGQTAIWFLLILLLLVPDSMLNGLAAFFDLQPSGFGPVTVSFWAGLLTLIPLAVTLGMMAFVYQTGKTMPPGFCSPGMPREGKGARYYD